MLARILVVHSAHIKTFPSRKHQTREKSQAPNPNGRSLAPSWDLRFGIFLGFGAWDLELGTSRDFSGAWNLELCFHRSSRHTRKSMRYFDHNASSPLLPEAREAWLEASERFFGNPSSPHRMGSRADRLLTDAREQLAAFLGCDALDIVWTSGATESNNMVLHHASAKCGIRSAECAGASIRLPSQEVWVSAIEHPCVLRATARHFSQCHRLIPVTRDGVIDWGWLQEQLRLHRPSLVAIMAANNETGVLQPWDEAFQLCREREVPFFCDAAQWLGKLPAKGLGLCDFVSGCAHKFGGPKGVGFLKCPAKGRLQPLMLGGEQEDGRRAGTENVAGVAAMIAALKVRESALARAEEKQRLEWRHAFELTLQQSLPGVQIVGTSSNRLWNTVSALMPEARDEWRVTSAETESRHSAHSRWVVKLDKIGFAVSTGSACA